MIVGYSFFTEVDPNTGYDLNNMFDTAIPTSQLTTWSFNYGVFDEAYMSLDTTKTNDGIRPDTWEIKNIAHMKFENDLEAGSLDADNHVITKIQIYRRVWGNDDNDWILVGEFPYDKDFNTYSFVDITAKSGVFYEYANVPVADNVIGEIQMSEPVKVDYKGVFISDLQHNYRLEYDFELGDVSYNRNSGIHKPLNSRFPVVTYGNQNYRTGSISFLPISQEQIDSGGKEINNTVEYEVRDKVTEFLNNGKSKVIRNDNGDITIVAINSVKSTPKDKNILDIHNVEFDYTEIGKVESGSLSTTGLVGSVTKSNYRFDENGEIYWDIN